MDYSHTLSPHSKTVKEDAEEKQKRLEGKVKHSKVQARLWLWLRLLLIFRSFIPLCRDVWSFYYRKSTVDLSRRQRSRGEASMNLLLLLLYIRLSLSLLYQHLKVPKQMEHWSFYIQQEFHVEFRPIFLAPNFNLVY